MFKIRCSAISNIMAPGPGGGLSTGAITYLKEWYAERVYGKQDFWSKYTDKGNYCESEAIDIIVQDLGLGVASKNTEKYENGFMTGHPDVVTRPLLEIKCPWDGKTFLANILGPIDPGYWAQVQGYMALTGIYEAKLCYILMDTPEECNYGNEIIYSHLPLNIRKKYFDIKFDPAFINKVEAKVLKCREWLVLYEKEVEKALTL